MPGRAVQAGERAAQREIRAPCGAHPRPRIIPITISRRGAEPREQGTARAEEQAPNRMMGGMERSALAALGAQVRVPALAHGTDRHQRLEPGDRYGIEWIVWFASRANSIKPLCSVR